MVEVTCYSGANGNLAQVDVDTTALGEVVRKRLMRQAFLHYAAAHRQGTHSTLTRSEVKCNQRKPWRQKGTGRARSGDFASPIWRGGGVVFGPKPRNYTSRFPRRMRKEALRSALLGKLKDGEIKLVEDLTFDEPKTKRALAVLDTLEIRGQRAVLVIAERGENLFKSFRNLREIDVVMASDLNAEHVLRSDQVLIDRKALDLILGRLGNA